MPTTGVTFQRFGGVVPGDQWQTAGIAAAQRAVNVQLTKSGELERRPGFVTRTAGRMSSHRIPYPIGLDGDTFGGEYRSGTVCWITAHNGVNRDVRLEQAVPGTNQDFVLASSTTGRPVHQDGENWHFSSAAHGTATTQDVYLAYGAAALEKLTRQANGSFTRASVTVPFATDLVAVWPDKNRVAIAHPDGRVLFSNPGVLTFETTVINGATVYPDEVRLTPNDGEPILAMVHFNNALFVFKRTKFFRIYAEQVGRAGEDNFLFTTISGDIGPVGVDAVSVGRDGVYVLTSEGVFVTTGGPLQRLIGQLGQCTAGHESNSAIIKPNHRTRLAVFGDRAYLSGDGMGSLGGLSASYWIGRLSTGDLTQQSVGTDMATGPFGQSKVGVIPSPRYPDGLAVLSVAVPTFDSRNTGEYVAVGQDYQRTRSWDALVRLNSSLAYEAVNYSVVAEYHTCPDELGAPGQNKHIRRALFEVSSMSHQGFAAGWASQNQLGLSLRTGDAHISNGTDKTSLHPGGYTSTTHFSDGVGRQFAHNKAVRGRRVSIGVMGCFERLVAVHLHGTGIAQPEVRSGLASENHGLGQDLGY